jgi:hypothetical protein
MGSSGRGDQRDAHASASTAGVPLGRAGTWVVVESRLGARAAVIVCAIVINLCIRNVGLSAGADFIVLDQGDLTHVTYGAVAFTTILFTGAGLVVLAVLERVISHAKVIWILGALALLALTALPIVASHGSLVTKVFLGIINTATVALVVPVMRRTTRPRPLWSRRSSGVGAGVSSTRAGA